MLVWFMIVAILQQAGLKTFSSHESLWIIPLSCIGIFPCFFFFFFFFLFWLFSNFFLLKGKKEKWVDAVDRVSEKKRKKRPLLKERKGKSGVICRFIKWCQVLDS